MDFLAWGVEDIDLDIIGVIIFGLIQIQFWMKNFYVFIEKYHPSIAMSLGKNEGWSRLLTLHRAMEEPSMPRCTHALPPTCQETTTHIPDSLSPLSGTWDMSHLKKKSWLVLYMVNMLHRHALYALPFLLTVRCPGRCISKEMKCHRFNYLHFFSSFVCLFNKYVTEYLATFEYKIILKKIYSPIMSRACYFKCKFRMREMCFFA